VFLGPTLNAFAALGRSWHNRVRLYLRAVLTAFGPHPGVLERNEELRRVCVLSQEQVEMLLPLQIGDYTDFYAGKTHAYNVGVLFRGEANALQRNYEWLPVGYHGRASSVVVSGTAVVRPRGQVLPSGAGEPVWRECERLDLELEMAAFVAVGNGLGEPIPVEDAEECVFGYVLMNDWSARDVQTWEYVPLGPFTSKNFATSISPWVVLHDALEPFRARKLERKTPGELGYLKEEREDSVFDVKLEVEIGDREGRKGVLARTSSRNLLFSFPQMLAHHTVTGCNMRTGDLLGTGTISGEGKGEAGCLLEASRNGQNAVDLGEGLRRRWLEDGDEVVIRGSCGEGRERVGWGKCRGRVLPARK